MVRNILITIRLTVRYILLPTTDVLGDINFAIRALCSHNFGIGCAMILPIVLNMAFNLYKWTSTEYDTQKEKRFTWLLVILNVWPQYQVLKLILLILCGTPQEVWLPWKDKIKQELSFTEPFVVAVPQFFISVFVFFLLFHWNGDGFTDVFGKTTLGVDTGFMFRLKICVSYYCGIKSIVDYLLNRPMKINSNNKFAVSLSMVIYISTAYVTKLSYITPLFLICYEYGIVVLLIAISIFIFFSTLISIGPIARVTGLRICTRMLLERPELLVLSLITEYALGPVDGGRYYPTCLWCCCKCWLCCTWYCFCEGCEPRKTKKAIISKELSWNKMLYINVILMPFYICLLVTIIWPNDISISIWSNFSKSRDVITPIYIFSFILLLLGLICFAITLHCTNSKGVLDLQHLEDTRDEEYEMQAPSISHSQAVVDNDQIINNREVDLPNNIDSRGTMQQDFELQSENGVDLQNTEHNVGPQYIIITRAVVNRDPRLKTQGRFNMSTNEWEYNHP